MFWACRCCSISPAFVCPFIGKATSRFPRGAPSLGIYDKNCRPIAEPADPPDDLSRSLLFGRISINPHDERILCGNVILDFDLNLLFDFPDSGGRPVPLTPTIEGQSVYDGLGGIWALNPNGPGGVQRFDADGNLLLNNPGASSGALGSFCTNTQGTCFVFSEFRFSSTVFFGELTQTTAAGDFHVISTHIGQNNLGTIQSNADVYLAQVSPNGSLVGRTNATNFFFAPFAGVKSFSSADGTENWSAASMFPFFTAQCIALDADNNSYVLIGGKLVKFDVNGARVWQVTPSIAANYLCVSGSRIYTVAQNGTTGVMTRGAWKTSDGTLIASDTTNPASGLGGTILSSPDTGELIEAMTGRVGAFG